MRKLAIAVLAVLPVFAQQTQPSTQPQQTFFTESIEVRVINVDVVVTKDGHPATGLTKDDFELFENGKPQSITNFLEIRGEERPAGMPATGASTPTPNVAKPSQDPRGRNLVVFLDATSVQPFTRDSLMKPLQQFIDRAVSGGDRIMIVSWNPGLKVDQPLTTDREEAIKTLQRMVGTMTAGVNTQRDFAEAKRDLVESADGTTQRQMLHQQRIVTKPPIADGIARARGYAARAEFAQSQRIEALKSILASMRGLSGRNALVLLTDQLSRNPSLPIFYYLDSQKEKYEGGSSFNPVEVAREFEQSNIIKELADLANSTGVVLYPISASGLGIDNANVTAENSNGEYGAVTRQVFGSDDGLMTLRQIAAATGGTALTGSSNFQLAFNTISQDLSNYYSLGYHTEGARQDAVRTISVKLKKKGYNVRTRESFVEKSLTSEMQDAVASNLLYPITKNDLNVTIAAAGAPARTENDRRIVPVFVKIPTTGLTLIPDGTDLVGQFSSFTAFMRRDGKVSEVKKLQHQLRFPADSLKRRKEITVKLELTIDDKTEDVSVGVMDDASHATGFARLSVS